MNEPTEPDRLGHLVAEETRHLAERVDALHHRVVSLVGDADDGPALYVGLAASALTRAADDLAPRQPVTHGACGHRHAPGTPCPQVGR